MESTSPILERVVERLDAIEIALRDLVGQKHVKDWYSTSEVAALLGKAEFTVREWCRLGRVSAKKKRCGRGAAGEWNVSHDELSRLRNEGLLPNSSLRGHGNGN